MSEENFEQSKKDIKNIYIDLEEAVAMNKGIFLMPIELYQKILKKLGHMEDRIRSQTASLRGHLKEKQELKRHLKNRDKNNDIQ